MNTNHPKFFMRISAEKRQVALGLIAICFYLAHGAYLVIHNQSAHLLWTCHIGAVLIGLGLIFSMPLPNAIGVLWLGFGDVMWFLYLAGGGGFEMTSPLTHIGGLAIGIVGLPKMGFPKRSWFWALVSLVGLQQISRWATPEAKNINLAFRVHTGWENVFPSYGIYLAILLLISGLSFLAMEIGINRIIERRNPRLRPTRSIQ